jgi:hypothetical protein
LYGSLRAVKVESSRLRPPISTLTVLARRGEVAMDSREKKLLARGPPRQAENGIEAGFDES